MASVFKNTLCTNFQGSCDTDHCLVAAKVMEWLVVNKEQQNTVWCGKILSQDAKWVGDQETLSD